MSAGDQQGLANGTATAAQGSPLRVSLSPAQLTAWLADGGATSKRLLDWCAWGAAAAGTTVFLQLRDDDPAPDGATRLRLQVVGAEAGMPPLEAVWPAVAWPQREATERLGLRLAGASIPRPLWTAAAREAHDREDGVEPEDDGLELLAGPDAASPWRLDLRARRQGGLVSQVRARPGLLHSGLGPAAAARAFDQLPLLAEGLNDQAPFTPGLAAILAIEALLGVSPPPRCRRLRTALAEVSRIAAHCAWLATQAAGDPGLWARALATRDTAARVLAAASGRRWATGVHRIGGIAADWTADHGALLDSLAAEVDGLRRAAERRTVAHRGWRRRFDGVAAIDAATARAWAASGPVLRAAGAAEDVRRSDPYLDYGELEFDVPVGTRGDVVDRVAVRLEELGQSVSLCRQCLADLPAGPCLTHEPPRPSQGPTGPAEVIVHFERWMEGHGHRPPAGLDASVPTESADGELSFLLVSDGTGKPAYAHLRSPSLYHYQVLPALLEGQRQHRVAGIVASLNIVAPEVDR